MDEPTNDPGLTEPGELPVDHPYCVALDAGYFADPEEGGGDPQAFAEAHDNERYTVAGVIAAAAAAKEATT